MTDFPADVGQGGLERVRASQALWGALPVFKRLSFLREVRRALAKDSRALARDAALVRGVEVGEVLATEVLPLAAACRFLEEEAADILAPRRLGAAGQPIWLAGVSSEIRRHPHGIVLILAPSNYPLFLSGVQTLQALVAGNAVLLKPAPGTSAPVERFVRLLAEAGLPDGLVTLLPENPDGVAGLIRGRAIDKVVLTGGVPAGQAVLAMCAEAIVPATVELSGVDSFHVLADADAALAAALLGYGLGLNRGRTCIAPRRIYVQRSVAPALRERLGKDEGSRGHVPLAPWVARAVREALDGGAIILAGDVAGAGDDGVIRYPLVLEGVSGDSRLLTEDHFSPVAVFVEVESEEEALLRDQRCPFALGATVIGRDVGRATAFAARLPAPVVTVNDVIVPTGDPRLPFAGAKRSGFGSTRGGEGLLGMTVPRVLCARPVRGWRPYLDPGDGREEERFAHLLNLLHGQGMVRRIQDFWWLVTHRPTGTESVPGATGQAAETKELG